jgi:hypothetical protein
VKTTASLLLAEYIGRSSRSHPHRQETVCRDLKTLQQSSKIAKLCPAGSQNQFDSPANEEIDDRDRRDI